MSQIAVSVVICTHDRAVDLAANLPGVVASAAASARTAEVIVVDNAPVDGTTEAVVRRTTGARYLCHVQRGLGGARNAGVRAARGQAILFTDDDVAVPPSWVSGMAEPLIEGRCDITIGPVVPGDGRLQDWMSERFRRTQFFNDVGTSKPSHLIGANFGMSTAVARVVPFDENIGAGTPYGSGEDTLFLEQARHAGFSALGCPEQPVVHNFDLRRLQRSELIRAAASIGRTSAYIAHHWLGSDLRMVRLRLVLDGVRLRLLQRGDLPEFGISDREWNRTVALAHKRQLLRERKLPRRYLGAACPSSE